MRITHRSVLYTAKYGNNLCGLPRRVVVRVKWNACEKFVSGKALCSLKTKIVAQDPRYIVKVESGLADDTWL